MKKVILATTLAMGMAFAAHAKENTSAGAQAVDNSCTQEASTANCGNEKVGTGLLKCLHAYKKEHKEFKFSDNCKSAMKSWRAERKEEKSVKK